MDTRVDVLVEPLSLLMSEMTEIAARIESVHKRTLLESRSRRLSFATS